MQSHTTPRIAALYRHPVKGFTPESCDRLVVQPDGRIEGDRVLTFRFGDAPPPVEVEGGLLRWRKTDGLALVGFPALARLRLTHDAAAGRLRIEHDGTLLVDAGLDEAGRTAIVEAVTAFVLDTPDGERLREPGRLPLRLEGDGATSRFQDRPRGFVSLHGRGSLQALAEALGGPVDERRFRSNVVVEGLAPWEELGWTGRVRIGDVAFRAGGHVVRCLATHANPESGERDAPVMTTLTEVFAQERPTFGTLLLPAEEIPEGGAVIRLGDEVTVLE